MKTYAAIHFVKSSFGMFRGASNVLVEKFMKTEVGFDAAEGVYRWVSNDSIPPTDCYASYGIDKLPNFDLAKQLEVGKRETAAFLAAYRKHHEGRKATPEQEYELRAAFGDEADTVVNVITGCYTISGKRAR